MFEVNVLGAGYVRPSTELMTGLHGYATPGS
jgi:hypothetical protein